MDEILNKSYGHIGDHKDLHFFGEWVYCETEEERKQAYQYLALWKKFFIKKLPEMIQEGDDQIIWRPKCETQTIATLGIKIAMRRKENV